MHLRINILLLCFIENTICQQNTIKITLLVEAGQDYIQKWFRDSLDQIKSENSFDVIVLDVDESENDLQKVCTSFTEGSSFILDLSWSGSEKVKNLAETFEVPYLRIDVSISPFLKLMDKFLDFRNATDVSLIFDNTQNVDQALYFWIDGTRLRMVLTETLDKTSASRIKEMRPTPNTYAIIADTQNMSKILQFALQEEMLLLPERWNLVFLDFKVNEFERKLIHDLPIYLLSVEPEVCCYFLKQDMCECPVDFNLQRAFLLRSLELLSTVISNLIKEDHSLRDDVICDNTTQFNPEPKKRFFEILDGLLGGERYIYEENKVIQVNAMGNIERGSSSDDSVIAVAKYEDDQIKLVDDRAIPPIKPFYRIGITHAKPWSYQEKDENTGELYWTGYCADFARKLAEVMNFDFEFSEPKEGTLGEKKNGSWDGIVGDLERGETDLAISTIIMTADREEVIDFVAPYFEQTGITIVMRKPVRKTSLFKFMTVLKLEVWLSIVAALIVTACLICFLDKYSPYSARNNKNAYPYPCREFTLKESFWFALTSFTPQGGGEAPTALSGRTLVAAYWLFVVLMLATFTANLAAFLTVERMQTPVQSLDQLAKQSRINYTVVKESDTHQYFINMKNAEDILYRMWKELTLNASTDDTQYRVWDYPIREQYGHILLAINDSNPVRDPEEGFRMVEEHLDGDFAFIHDSAEIKYAVSRSCNLTEVGEVFAERPYAVAVQQGSHIQDDISRAILRLQKDRFFEELNDKYWNQSAKGYCPNTDDNEGITLESLGGVFIATLFGLALAMITLVGEVLYYRRKRSNNEVKEKPMFTEKINENLAVAYPITIGSTFKPVKIMPNIENPILANITVYPRGKNRNRVKQLQE